MVYLCAKFGDFIFSRLGFIVRINRQTDRQTESHTHTDTDTAHRLTHATVVGVSNIDQAYSQCQAKARFPLPELTARVNGPS